MSALEPRQRGRRSISKADRERFLELLEQGWTARDAAKATGRHHSTFYALRKDDEQFAAAWTEAWEAGTQAIEQEAYRRAVEGYDEETFDADGKLIRRVRRYSDALLQKLLAGRRPEMYGSSPQAVAIAAVPEHVEIEHKRGLTVGDLADWCIANGLESPNVASLLPVDDPRRLPLVNKALRPGLEPAPLALPPAPEDA